jgi:hypothetical protein
MILENLFEMGKINFGYTSKKNHLYNKKILFLLAKWHTCNLLAMCILDISENSLSAPWG